MKKFVLLYLTILVIFQFGCVTDDQPIEVIEESENELFYTPEGKLAFSFVYGGANTTQSGKTEYLYDSDSRLTKLRSETHVIGQVFHSDTRYEYNELDCLVWDKKYNLIDEEPVFNLAYERIFDPETRQTEVRAHRADGTERWVYRNLFDDNNRLVKREMQGGEWEVYTYMADGKTATMRQQFANSDLSIGHLYRYDDNQRLIAKEYFVIRGDSIPESGEGNIEEFDYDDQNRLVESRYYDPNFGFVLQGRITYEYY
ncbi:hypothetical protein [Lunatimonas lonarensis]|uniref:hypothetical protein n=1 Tax=Lunatimonas lonarensis TaxID=1232681 RepID=UPI00055B210A|nr:hypothetical protein [Lunatimonas lonarensis]